MKNIFILITFTLITIGCGGSGGSGGSSAPDAPGLKPGQGDTEMVLNEMYSVSSGDQILKSAPLTRVQVTHVEGSRGSSVVLIEGSAILRVQ